MALPCLGAQLLADVGDGLDLSEAAGRILGAVMQVGLKNSNSISKNFSLAGPKPGPCRGGGDFGSSRLLVDDDTE